MLTPRFRGVIFDMDGTLTHPTIDFDAIRKELGAVTNDIAVAIHELPADEQAAAWAVIERHEEVARQQQELKEGMQSLLRDLRASGVRVAVVTRNVQRSVDALCEKFDLTFDAVVTRDFPHLKPHPGPILHILDDWKIEAQQSLMVGDYIHDVDCGRAAGTQTCFLQNPGFPDHGADADFIAQSVEDLRRIVFA